MTTFIPHNDISAREARFVRANVPLAPCTTFRIGGNAKYFAEVTSDEELHEALLFARTHHLKHIVLGGGSNLLVADEGFQGLVIHMAIRGIMHDMRGEHINVTVGAGEMLDDVVQYAAGNNWWGIENLSAIPGTIGGAAVQNAGAYGVELSTVIDSVGVYDLHTNSVRTLSHDECMYGYRDSVFKAEIGKHLIITQVVLTLSRTPMPQLTYKDLAVRFPSETASLIDIREAVITIRAAKFPDLTKYGTAGSFFKNPCITEAMYTTLRVAYEALPGYTLGDGTVKIPVAWILDHVLNLRGVRVGSIGAWDAQPLVLTNYGGAAAHAVDTFATSIEQAVKEHTGIELEREVVWVQ